MRRSSRIRIGISIGADAAEAVVRLGAETHTARAKLELPRNGADPTPAITAAFHALREKLTAALGDLPRNARICVALLPPLVAARLIPLPPLRQAEAEMVVRRDAGKFFLGDVGPRVVAVRASGPTRSGPRRGAAPEGRTPALAVSAPAAIVEGLFPAAAAVGFRVNAVVPAYAAWLAAARAAGGPITGARAVIAVENETAHVMRLDGETVVALRRVPAVAAEIVEALGTGPGQVVLLAETARRNELAPALTAAGWIVVKPGGRGEAASRVAARFAACGSLELVPTKLAAERRRQERVLAGRLAAAAVLLLVAAGVAQLWGARRELHAIRAEREAIREQVMPLQALDDEFVRLADRVQALNGLAAEAPRWTRAVYELATLLPHDAHVRAIHAVGDSVRIEATGARAGAVLEALRRAESLRDVRLQGTIDRVLEDGATALERFTLVAVFARPETTTAETQEQARAAETDASPAWPAYAPPANQEWAP